MNKEDKELLLQDLCARLPYKVLCKCRHDNNSWASAIDIEDMTIYYFSCDEWESIEWCKPYLRPLSSMTEEERAERISILWELEGHINEDVTYKYQDWCNKNHFDYRGLIPKGLAIEVTEDNNPYK